jgi:hypothetical protein
VCAVKLSPSGNLITGGKFLGPHVITFHETLGQLGSLCSGMLCPRIAASASCSARIVSHVSFSVPNLQSES